MKYEQNNSIRHFLKNLVTNITNQREQILRKVFLELHWQVERVISKIL
jgi:hypothetical protein